MSPLPDTCPVKTWYVPQAPLAGREQETRRNSPQRWGSHASGSANPIESDGLGVTLLLGVVLQAPPNPKAGCDENKNNDKTTFLACSETRDKGRQERLKGMTSRMSPHPPSLLSHGTPALGWCVFRVTGHTAGCWDGGRGGQGAGEKPILWPNAVLPGFAEAI